MTDIDKAIKWLEDQATYYEISNNSAVQSTKDYHREDCMAWEVARLIKRLRAQRDELLAVSKLAVSMFLDLERGIAPSRSDFERILAAIAKVEEQ